MELPLLTSDDYVLLTITPAASARLLPAVCRGLYENQWYRRGDEEMRRPVQQVRRILPRSGGVTMPSRPWRLSATASGPTPASINLVKLRVQ